MRIGITGGIGSGKSHVCHILEQQIPRPPIFYCDDEAKRIIRQDDIVKKALTSLVGEAVYAPDGTLIKSVLSAYICQGEAFSHRVDAIVHPRVADAWHNFCQQHADSPYIYMECALLFESGFAQYVDRTLHVAAPHEVRLARIMRRDHISSERAVAWMSLQMPEEEKKQRADMVINNDGEADICQQLAALALYKA